MHRPCKWLVCKCVRDIELTAAAAAAALLYKSTLERTRTYIKGHLRRCAVLNFRFKCMAHFSPIFFVLLQRNPKKKNLKFLSPQIRYGKFNLNSLEKYDYLPNFISHLSHRIASHCIEITKNDYISILHVCYANDPNWEEVNIGGDAAAFGYRYLSRRFEIRTQSLKLYIDDHHICNDKWWVRVRACVRDIEMMVAVTI